MNILFLCLWPLRDVLTAATVLPNISMLSKQPFVKSIVLVTLENEPACGHTAEPFLLEPHCHVKWAPFAKTGGNRSSLVFKLLDFWQLPSKLAEVIKVNQINCILAQGAPAGAQAYKVWQKKRIPFYVSSFEPHADYMADTGTWPKPGLKYLFQKHWEQQIKKHASGLMPVTASYAQQLLCEGVPKSRVFTVPVGVKAADFCFNHVQREQLRKELGIAPGTVVGIYVGKYGGLYYKSEAFVIYKECFKLFPHFFLIILSPQDSQEIAQQLKVHQLDMHKVLVKTVPHREVPQYLSAADFALATIKSYPSAQFCSPVKVGEYWANGLPVLLTEGVGNDSDIIKHEGGGALYNLQQRESLKRALLKIQAILQNPGHRQEIPKLAYKYRSSGRAREAYDYFFGRKGGGVSS